MTVELLGLAAARRAEPRDDVVSMLATYEEDGESLTDDELGMFLIQLLVAGNETTRNAISGALVALAEHPEQLDRLAADPSLLPTAVEEVLRWTTPVTSFLRTAVADTELGGTADRGRRPAAPDLRRGQPRRGRVRAHRRHLRRRPHAEPPRGARPRPPLLPRRRAGPPRALGRARGRRRALAAPRRSPGPVVRSGSSVISGIKSAPLTLEPR